jgi:hypothetical protein
MDICSVSEQKMISTLERKEDLGIFPMNRRSLDQQLTDFGETPEFWPATFHFGLV